MRPRVPRPAPQRGSTPARVARDARARLRAMARPAGEFDASRYFRGDHQLRFLNVGTARVRALARSVRQDHPEWSIGDAMRFAGALVPARELEVKSLAIAVVAGYRRGFRPAQLPAWRQWLVRNHSANWATTDAICGELIGPLLVAHPRLAAQMGGWARHRNLWVRRAAAVSLIPSVRRGLQLDLAYQIARSLEADREDLIHKAVGWMLREAGKTDPERLCAYLLARGPAVPRTTLRYAAERFAPATRRQLLQATKAPGRSRGPMVAGRPQASRRSDSGNMKGPPGVSRTRD